MFASRTRLTLAATLALASTAAFVSCSDAPTAPVAAEETAPMINKNRQPTPIVLPVTGALSDGGTFSGTVTIRALDLGAGRTLVASGVISGTAVTAAGVTRSITDQPFSAPIAITRVDDVAAALPAVGADALVRPASMPGADAPIFRTVAMQEPAPDVACDVLNLDLGPLFLNLLGLTVDLAPVVLDVRAVPGAGNLLGNLLCAIVSLLDGPGALAAILQILGNITTLLGGLTAPAA